MQQTSKRQRHALHLWITLLTVLALAALYPVEILTARRPSTTDLALEPALYPPGGYYDHDVRLEIRPPHPDSRVIFTLDGRTPTHTAGELYTQPIHLSTAAPAVTVVRARAIMPGGELGPVVSASYFVGLQAELPLISLIMEPSDLWDPNTGIYANPRERGSAWERSVDVTYVDSDRRSGFHVPAGARIHGQYSRDFEKKSLRLYFRREYGASRLEYPLFAANDVQSFKRLILHSGGQDWHAFHHMNWTLIRNQLAANLAFQLGGYATHSQPALLFINGEPEGIYQIRERIDRHFLLDHYDIASADFIEAPEHVWDQAILIGDSENWDHLFQFVATHDLADPANYAYVQSQIDIANFVDYNILQIYLANTDWPHRNVRQFRPRAPGGRWRWIVWDSDHGFGTHPDSDVSANVVAHLLDYNDPYTDGRDVLVIRKLLKNPQFLQRLLARAADLLNTTLAPSSVSAHIDALATEIEPDIAYETARWSDVDNWKTSIQELHDFARRRPDFVRQHLVERLNTSGVTQLTFNPPVSGCGSVAVNGSLVQELPWQGVYFRGVPVQITAAPAAGYRFAGWEPPDLSQTSTITLTLAAAQTIAPRFEPLQDNVPHPGDVVFADHWMGEGKWFELRVLRAGWVDLRGWRITDNDTKAATDEGSLIFADDPALARVPSGTTIRVVVGEDGSRDDLSYWDRQMVLHVGNPALDAHTDPGFSLGPSDNLVLLAPGPTPAFSDDRGIDFITHSAAVTPASFGVLSDGVQK